MPDHQASGHVLVDVSIDRALVERAEALGVDVRAVAEDGLHRRLRGRLSEQDLEDIRASIRDHDAYIEQHGSFADAWRQF